MWANLYICTNGSFWCGNGPQCTADLPPYEYLSWPHGEVIGVANQTQSSLSDPTNQIQGSVPGSRVTNKPQGSLSTTMPIGVVVGICVPFAIISITLGSLYLRERKRRKAIESSSGLQELEAEKINHRRRNIPLQVYHQQLEAGGQPVIGELQ
ncbi:hypothetical protein V8E54_012784 [Elaphomyces granulatus]